MFVDAEVFAFPTIEDVLAEMALDSETAEEIETSPEVDARIQEAAVQKANEMIAQAEQQAMAIKKQAIERGQAEGREQGRIAAKKEIEATLDNFKESLQQLAELQKKILKDSEDEIVDLTMEIARKVIGAELDLDPGAVAKVIKTAISRIGGGQEISVRLNPKDHEYLQKSPPEFLRNVKMTPDPKLARGGAVIDMATGSLDAQIEEQLAEIEKNLRRGVVEAVGEGP
jgi:flagellar assembly protein FliH